MGVSMNIGFTDLFWIFIVLTSLQPVLKQRFLEASGKRLMVKSSEDAGHG
jgi:hypothetical protein